MTKKLIKVALIGKTNVGKSTLINSFVGEKISIINKKINTTQNLILGITNINESQIIFYDTPGSNILKTNSFFQKKLKTNVWEAISRVDLILYIVDSSKYSFENIQNEIIKISELKKIIILVFNKIDLIENKKILPYIKELEKMRLIDSYFNISAKYDQGVDSLCNYLPSKALINNWLYNEDEISDKNDIFISNECTRNAILEFIHKEIPYNIKVNNTLFRFLKNNDLKIKQSIELKNKRYKPVILGKNGAIIKKIREHSQKEIGKILNSKVHLYLQVIVSND